MFSQKIGGNVQDHIQTHLYAYLTLYSYFLVTPSALHNFRFKDSTKSVYCWNERNYPLRRDVLNLISLQIRIIILLLLLLLLHLFLRLLSFMLLSLFLPLKINLVS
jgi:hypothetical protein